MSPLTPLNSRLETSIPPNQETIYRDLLEQVSVGAVPREALIHELREGFVPKALLRKLIDENGYSNDEFLQTIITEVGVDDETTSTVNGLYKPTVRVPF